MIYLLLFWEFFKIGLFTFGGGFAMIPLIQDAVNSKGWLVGTDFYSLIGICESTPGPVAINMATYIGSCEGGILGSICATLGVVLPSFIIILIIASIFKKFISNKYFTSVVKGVTTVITALILTTGLMLFFKCIGVNLNVTNFSINISFVSIIILIVLFSSYLIVFKVFKKKMSSVMMILISIVLGISLGYIFNL